MSGCVILFLYWLCEHTNIIGKTPGSEEEFPRIGRWNLESVITKILEFPSLNLKDMEIKQEILDISEKDRKLFESDTNAEDEENEMIDYVASEETCVVKELKLQVNKLEEENKSLRVENEELKALRNENEELKARIIELSNKLKVSNEDDGDDTSSSSDDDDNDGDTERKETTESAADIPGNTDGKCSEKENEDGNENGSDDGSDGNDSQAEKENEDGNENGSSSSDDDSDSDNPQAGLDADSGEEEDLETTQHIDSLIEANSILDSTTNKLPGFGNFGEDGEVHNNIISVKKKVIDHEGNVLRFKKKNANDPSSLVKTVKSRADRKQTKKALKVKFKLKQQDVTKADVQLEDEEEFQKMLNPESTTKATNDSEIKINLKEWKLTAAYSLLKDEKKVLLEDYIEHAENGSTYAWEHPQGDYTIVASQLDDLMMGDSIDWMVIDWFTFKLKAKYDTEQLEENIIKPCFFFSSYAWTELRDNKNGEACAKYWNDKIDKLNGNEKIFFIPFNSTFSKESNHWTLLVFDQPHGWRHYNSLPTDKSVKSDANKLVKHVSPLPNKKFKTNAKKKNCIYFPTKITFMENCPQQGLSDDCGLFVCKFMNDILRFGQLPTSYHNNYGDLLRGKYTHKILADKVNSFSKEEL